MPTYQIKIEGKVQGVGFRPFVYQLAQKLKLKGWVNNGNEGVKIEINCSEETLDIFLEKLYSEKPQISYITKLSFQEIQVKNFKDFKIIHSEDVGQKKLLLAADLDTCKKCLEDFYNPESRFYQYPFVACTYCGTRYSIIKKLPYDRENTSMQDFNFCKDCQTEYNNPLDRRFYTQNHSCSTCGVELFLYNTDNQLINKNFKSLEKAVELLKEGKILAIKGIGGFLLIADACNRETVKKLRDRKYRPTKPFALMYPDLETIKKDVLVFRKEEEFLQSREKPIVLLEVKKKIERNICLEEIAPEIMPKKLGIMLPYTAFLDFILKKVQKPLIATSGNISQSPIIFQNQKALEELNKIADFILLNNREILIPQDDSVLRFSTKYQKKIIIRRSRGFAPNYQTENIQVSKNILALGAELKSSFSLSHAGNIYTSQYLGDLQSFDTQESFKKTLEHFLNLFEAKPEIIITDKHPAYFTTNLGEILAKEWNIPHKKIQHHKAHFWAVLGENLLLEEKVLGVIWDGTGLGNDEQIWGGEFFTYENQSIRRIESFSSFSHILADKMPKEPRISALTITSDLPNANTILEKKFTKNEWKIYQKIIENNTKKLQNSSIGRIFDASACLLDLGDKQSFEGEAAMKLEALAQNFFNKNPNFQEHYQATLNTKNLFQEIIEDILKKKNKEEIAFKFHLTLIKIIENIAQKHSFQKIAFSGGVWQNALLVDLTIEKLSQEFELYFHKQLSPNDENISFGQLISFI